MKSTLYPDHDYSWRARWLVNDRWAVLHRVLDDSREEKDWAWWHGTSACGREDDYQMPGFPSRMGLKRCSRCCRRLGLPDGYGAPFNDDTLTEEQRNA